VEREREGGATSDGGQVGGVWGRERGRGRPGGGWRWRRRRRPGARFGWSGGELGFGEGATYYIP